jgi:hypothetical protein
MHPDSDGVGTNGVADATTPTDKLGTVATEIAIAAAVGDLVVLAELEGDTWIDDPAELRRLGRTVRYGLVVDATAGYLVILPPAAAYELPFRKVG